MTTRQVRIATMLKEILDIMMTTNWCRMELKEKNKYKHIQKANARDKEIKRQIHTLEGVIRHQIKFSGTENADINTDLQNKLQYHIQMTAGKQRDITNRILAMENHIQFKKRSLSKLLILLVKQKI